jgi:hypothetical protein
MSDHVRDIVAGIGWLKSGGLLGNRKLGRPNALGGLGIETLATGSVSGSGIFHQLTDFCADQNRGFAGSNALIALQ